MARARVSRRQKPILRLLMVEHHRTHGGTSMGHLELVKALAGDKSHISHSLRTLETRGWIVIGRTPGGRAEYLDLTPEGLEKASDISIQL
jgi:DNA-binding MarR family transcriptional regulator